MNNKNNILSFNDKLYYLIRMIAEDSKLIQFDTGSVDFWKEYLHADTVLKKDQYLYFCSNIDEPQIIEDTIEINNNEGELKNAL